MLYFKKIFNRIFRKKQNPIHTQKLHDFIKEKSSEGVYRVTIENVLIDVFPGVFPPKSELSASSKALYSNLGDLTGKEILDIGTGTGIDAIIAAKKVRNMWMLLISLIKHSSALNITSILINLKTK